MIIYEENDKLRTSDFDYHDNIKISSILSLFQDVAGFHATNIGLGYQDTLDKGMFWVLVRTKYEQYNKFIPLTNVKITTFPHKQGRVDFDREYIIEDTFGNILARGISKWVLINKDTRRISRTDKVSFPIGEYVEPFFNNVDKLNMPDISLFNNVYSYKVLKRDVDHNLHTNNIVYANIIEEVVDNINVSSFYIEHITETHKDDIIDLFEYRDNNKLYYKGYSLDKLIFNAIIEVI